MISAIYRNRELYYHFMKDFLERKITPWEFRTRYWDQRDKDLDENKENGYRDYYLSRVLMGNSAKFQKEYDDPLYEEGFEALKKYEQGANALDIKGEMFFMGMWYFIDDYVREYYPSDNEGFDPSSDVDEQTLTKIIQAFCDILERNKMRWEKIEDAGVKI